MPQLKLLISSSIFPNRKEITKGIYIFHLAKALSKYCDLRIIAPVPYFPTWIRSKTYSSYATIPERERIEGLEVFHPRVAVIPKVGRSIYGFLYAASLYLPFRRLVTRFRPDSILCYWAYPDGFANVLLARWFGIPTVLGGRGCDINNATESQIRASLVTWALKKSHRLLAVSYAMKENMLHLGVTPKKITVIPNGLNQLFSLEHLKELGKEQNEFSRSAKSSKRILYCGRLGPEKGLEYLIYAADILRRQGVPFELCLIGDGLDRVRIQRLVQQYGMEERVTFIGEIPQHEVPGLMISADVFCLPSLREGWPNVVMEALACGVPVVASRVGGVPELLTSPEYGIMVPSENPQALAEALMKAFETEWNPSVIQAAVGDRTWDHVALETLEVVRSVLNT